MNEKNISALVLGLLFFAPLSFAESFRGAITWATFGNSPDAQDYISIGVDQDANIQQTGSLSLPNGATMSYDGYARAGYDALQVSSQSTFSIPAFASVKAITSASATLYDTLTINAPADANIGDTGFLNIFYYIDGTIASAGSSKAYLSVTSGLDPNMDPLDFIHECTNEDFYPNTGRISGLYAQSFAVTFGTPYRCYFRVTAATGTYWINPLNNDHRAVYMGSFINPGALAGSGTVDFAHSLNFTGFNVTDSTGNVINAGITSESGALYTSDGIVAPVPEPATILTLGMGLGLIGIAAWRRKSS